MTTNKFVEPHLKKSLLLFPIGLAYALRGGKTGLTFLPVFLFIGGLYLFLHKRFDSRSVPRRLLLPFLLFLLWCWMPLLGGAPLDIHLFYYSRIFLYVLMGLVVVQFSDATILEDFKRLVAGAAGVEALFIIVAKIFGRDPQFGGYLGNSLHSGLILALGAAAALSKIKSGSRREAWVYGVVAALIVIGIALIRSRAALLSLMVIFPYYFPRKTAWIALAGALVAALLFAIQGEVFLSRWKLDSFGHLLTSGRFSVWLTALDAILARPLIGFGLGNFEVPYRMFQHPSFEVVRYSKTTMFAHNGALQVAVDVGLPALALLMWGYVEIFRKSERSFLSERFLFSILFVFFIHSLFNYSLFLPSSGLIFSTAIGCLAARTWPSKGGVSLREHPLVPAFCIALFSIFLLSFGVSEAFIKKNKPELAVRWCPIQSEAWYELALKNLRAGKEALPYLKNSLSLNPQNSFVWQRLALVLANQKPLEEEAIMSSFSKAEALAPFHAPFYIQRGLYHVSKAQWAPAESAFQKAAFLEPAAPMPHYGLAFLYAQQGRSSDASTEMERVKSLKAVQQQLENDPANAGTYRLMFSSPYSQALFEIPTKK